jgi:ferric-dicitrate binding protein FerR (iron transport regulator)
MGEGWQTVQIGALLAKGDRVVTGDASALQIVLADGSSVALGANSELSLDNVGSGTPGSITLLSLARGLLDTMVEKLKLGSRFEVATPYAVAAVKGTDFEVSAAGQSAAVTVNQGIVQMGDSSRAYFWPVHPMEHCEMMGRRMTALRPLSIEEQGTFHRRWAMAHILHAHRHMLMRRLMRSPMHQRFMRQMRIRQRAIMARRRRRRMFRRRHPK